MAMTSWGPMTVLEDERRMWPEALQTVFCDALASAGPPPPPPERRRRWPLVFSDGGLGGVAREACLCSCSDT